MYSLPITTYADYWRATKVWTSYIGGLTVFAVGTRFSPLDIQKITQPLQMPYQQAFKSLNNKPVLEIASASPKWTEIKGINRKQTNTISEVSQAAAVFSGANKTGLSQELLRNIMVSRGEVKRGSVGQSSSIQDPLSFDKNGQNSWDQLSISETHIEDHDITFDTEYVETDEIPPGTSQIEEKGEPGVLRQVIKTFEVGGQIVDQQIQASFELKSPKTEVILRNTKPIAKKKVTISRNNPLEGPSPELNKANILKTLTVEATAYTFTGNKTATGIEPREGLIAVDPQVIALGSKVYIEGYGYAVAADTGGAIRGNRIDVFFSSLGRCMDWGRRSVDIYILNS